MNIDAYNSLSDKNKKILTEAIDAGYVALDKAYSASIDKYTPVAEKQVLKKSLTQRQS